MKPAKITAEQRDKLIKMCKALYPNIHNKAMKYAIKYYGSEKEAKKYCCGFYLTGNGVVQCSYPLYYEDDSIHKHMIIGIHWHELCWRILNKLMEDSGPLAMHAQIKNFGIVCFSNSVVSHPIDYIYELFKLKK